MLLYCNDLFRCTKLHNQEEVDADSSPELGVWGVFQNAAAFATKAVEETKKQVRIAIMLVKNRTEFIFIILGK